MSTINKILIGVGTAMLLALAGETWFIHHQTKVGATTQEVNKELSAKIASASSVIASQAAQAEVTNLVVSQTTAKILNTETKKLPLIQKVDNIAKQVKDEKISSSNADAAYISSMWAAYCTSGSADPHCQPSSGQSAE